MGMGRHWPGLGRDVRNTVSGSSLFPQTLRARFLAATGMDIGKATIAPKVWFGSNRITIGDRTFINQGCMFNTSAPIIIGADCAIGMRCVFVTSTHDIGPPNRRAGAARAEPITVGDGCWIGASVTILPGVTIGDGAIIAAGAVITGDCEPHAMYGGVPARKIRELAQTVDAPSV